jgi:hypothetical protein
MALYSFLSELSAQKEKAGLNARLDLPKANLLTNRIIERAFLK